jgi:diadenosine tetraphosphate (Ap4A) HIT family hydrolase
MEDEYAIAILSKSPFREGNCTIWVKRHVTSISEVRPEENASVFSMITKISKALELYYGAEKTWLLSIADQVKHIHYHLIPKLKGQISMGYYSFIKLAEAEGALNPSEEELSHSAERITDLILNTPLSSI